MDETTNKDLEAIEELHRQDVAATKAGDYETLMSLMDEECIVFPPDSEPEDGRAYLSRFRASSDSIEPEPEILELLQDWEEVRLLGEFAYEQGIVRYAVRDASGAGGNRGGENRGKIGGHLTYFSFSLKGIKGICLPHSVNKGIRLLI